MSILSRSSTWSLGRTQPLWAMSTCHHSQDSGPRPLQQCSRQDWKPGFARRRPGSPMGAMQVVAGGWKKGDSLEGPEPLGNPPWPSGTLFCGHLLLPQVWQSCPWGGTPPLPAPKEWGWVHAQSAALMRSLERGIYC